MGQPGYTYERVPDRLPVWMEKHQEKIEVMWVI
jgi:hypothetical protein